MRRMLVCLLGVLVFSGAFFSVALAAQRGASGQNGYTLVLFPMKVITSWNEGYADRAESLAAEGVANVAKSDSLLELKYTYRQAGDTAGKISLEDIAGSKNINVWRQVSLFSDYSPDWNQVKAIGSKIGADIAVLIRIRNDQDSLLAVYLYDFKKGNIYSKTSTGVYWGSMAEGVQGITETLVQEFYDNQ